MESNIKTKTRSSLMVPKVPAMKGGKGTDYSDGTITDGVLHKASLGDIEEGAPVHPNTQRVHGNDRIR